MDKPLCYQDFLSSPNRSIKTITMQAIVLAAGEGSRMRPLTSSTPKVMLPVCGRPFLEHIILRAAKAGIDEVVLVVGYGQDSVRSYFLDGRPLGLKIEYAVQDQQLGTGHALMAAEELAQDKFLVLNGDVLPDVESLQTVVGAGDMAVATKKVPDPRRYGVFLMQGGHLKSVVEKSQNPPSDMANAGIYLLTRSVFDALSSAPISERGEYELTDGLNALASREMILVKEIKDWIEIGRPWDILEVNALLMKDLKSKNDGEVEDGVTLKGNVSIGKGTKVRSGAYIEGPVIIGKDCDIGPNCYIRPRTCLGDRVRVGNAVEVKNSTIMNDTKVGHLSYLGDSVVGQRCNFGAGTIASNLRHDKGNVWSYIKGKAVDSGRRKLGVIMGNDVKTGIHTSIYPGTVIEAGCRSRPGEVLRGFMQRPD